MSDCVDELLEEYNDLNEKMVKLSKFTSSSKFTELNIVQRGLLSKQMVVMSKYAHILESRLKLA